MENIIIKLENINKTFKDKSVIENFNLEIEEGDFIALIGKSGQGKTTLLNIMGLLEQPTNGSVTIKNIKNPDKKQKLLLQRNDIGYIFQNYALIDNETVKQNVLISLEYKKYSKTEKNEKIKEVLKILDLENFENKKVYTLSGGEQQRVAIARIILKESNIIFADEPTGNLDEENRNMILEIFKRLNEIGKTIIISTHDEYMYRNVNKVIKAPFN